MPKVQVTVAAKADPEIGKKRGRVKDTNGIIYQIPPTLLPMVVVGSMFEIDYKDDSFNGHAFRVIESIIPVGAMSPQQQMPAQPQTFQSPPSGSYSPVAGAGGYGARPGGTVSGMPATAPSTKDEDISTLAIAKEQLGKITPGDLEAGFHILKQSALMWRKFKKWQRTQDSDMDGDSVP